MNPDDIISLSTATSIIAPKSMTLDDVRDAMARIKKGLRAPKSDCPERNFSGLGGGFYSIGSIFDIPVVVSPSAFSVKSVIRGIPSKNKPNRNRPYYRRVTIKTSCAFLYKDVHGQMSAVLHTSLARYLAEIR